MRVQVPRRTGRGRPRAVGCLDRPRPGSECLSRVGAELLGELIQPFVGRRQRPDTLRPVPTDQQLVGRDSELSTIARALADPASGGVALIGPAGVGKSALARRAAELARETRPRRPRWSAPLRAPPKCPFAALSPLLALLEVPLEGERTIFRAVSQALDGAGERTLGRGRRRRARARRCVGGAARPDGRHGGHLRHPHRASGCPERRRHARHVEGPAGHACPGGPAARRCHARDRLPEPRRPRRGGDAAPAGQRQCRQRPLPARADPGCARIEGPEGPLRHVAARGFAWPPRPGSAT